MLITLAQQSQFNCIIMYMGDSGRTGRLKERRLEKGERRGRQREEEREGRKRGRG